MPNFNFVCSLCCFIVEGGKKLSFFSLSFHFVWEKMDVGEKKRALAGTGKGLFILFCFL